jgi:predicted RNA-binding Zn ribbon-like protein
MREPSTFVSGDLVLDLAGTRAKRRGPVREGLLEPSDLAHWIAQAGLVTEPVRVDGPTFAEALRLREALYRMALAAMARTPFAAEDCDLVNAHAARPGVRRALDPSGAVVRAGGARAALADLARAGIDLVSGERAKLIKECDWADCTRLFLDLSARGARRWCDMAQCGNRAKVGAFRARHSGP